MKAAGGAHTGTGSWLLQRASAAVMALLTPLLAWRIASAMPLDHTAWTALFAPLWMRLAMLVFTAALALHAWVGVRDICMDYVHHTGIRLALYLGVIVSLAVCVLWMAALLWSVH